MIAQFEIPAFEKRAAQQWGSTRPRCYMCNHFASNMPMTGRCDAGVKQGVVTSHDTMRGDGCVVAFNPKYPKFHETKTAAENQGEAKL